MVLTACTLFAAATPAFGAGTIRFETSADSRDFETGSIQSLAYRLGAEVGRRDSWRLGLQTGFLSASGRAGFRSSGLTDTRLYLGRRLLGDLEVRVAADLPTGSATASRDEIGAVRVLQDPLLDLPVRSRGSGLRVSTALGATFAPAIGWTFGLGAGWQDPSRYRPVEGGAGYEQGHRVSLSAVIEHRPGDWTWRTRTRWTRLGLSTYGEEQIDSDPAWSADTMLLRRWKRTSGWLQLRFSQPIEFVGARPEFNGSGRGNQAHISIGAYHKLLARLSVDGSISHVRFLGRGPRELGRSRRNEIHLGSELRLEAGRSLRADISVYRGHVSEAQQVASTGSGSWRGFQVQFGVRSHF